MPASLNCPTTSFIEIDDTNLLKEFVSPLSKVWQSLNVVDDCLVMLCVSEWHNLMYELFLSEGINSHQIQVQIYVLLRCPELSQAVHV